MKTKERRQCTAHSLNGGRCRNAPIKGGNVCHKHGGSAPQVKKSARERIIAAADLAAGNLIEWMNDKHVPWPQRVAVARDLLDRAGYNEVQKVAIGVDIPKMLFNSGIISAEDEDDIGGASPGQQWPRRRDDIVDAEVVEDDAPEPRRRDPGYNRPEDHKPAKGKVAREKEAQRADDPTDISPREKAMRRRRITSSSDYDSSEADPPRARNRNTARQRKARNKR